MPSAGIGFDPYSGRIGIAAGLLYDGNHGKGSRMNRSLFLLLSAAFIPSMTSAQTIPRVERDIAYAQPKNERQLLDVYAPPTGAKLPVVVRVHGGGWMQGSKDEVNHKPTASVERGFVFVPVNYHFNMNENVF
jgi:acetyl esterase/lipase